MSFLRCSQLICLAADPLSGTDTAPPVSVSVTGTGLGDPIEVGAAAEALRPPGQATPFSPLTLLSSKASVGHAEPASGEAMSGPGPQGLIAELKCDCIDTNFN